ncbi:MAG: MlaE family lipid ABC transporter permease subunit [Proteobacteria bacterium]|nr:MAG: MlaE family lipid ABC transporter permease subunit [Pseudomonadota bacterium]
MTQPAEPSRQPPQDAQSHALTAAPGFTMERREGGAGRHYTLAGELSILEPPDLWTTLAPVLRDARSEEPVTLDLSAVTKLDANSMALLAAARSQLVGRGVRCNITGIDDRYVELLALFEDPAVSDKPAHRPRITAQTLTPRKAEGVVEHIGRSSMAILAEGKEVISFFGALVAGLFGLINEPRTGNFREVPSIMERTGADAVPIVVLINFLIGFVMGFQGANSLKQFGANIFVADLVGLSVTRELAPLMTAIIICGRSGAAFAAELGSMKVAEEIDALRTMGFGPYRYLVFPRMFGLILVVPLLVLLGDFVGILGGLVVGVVDLGVGPRAYLNETINAVHVWDVVSGLIKSVAFATAIAVIACQQGFATSGGAEGVGRRTTSAVVASLFSLIVIDAIFTVIYRVFGS